MPPAACVKSRLGAPSINTFNAFQVTIPTPTGPFANVPGVTAEWSLDLPTHIQGEDLVVPPDSFFVMGDNSAISEDARYWDKPIDLPHEGLDIQSGRVPEQFMLGQAIFVYWPAGFRLFDTRFAIIPNFGDMRWIH